MNIEDFESLKILVDKNGWYNVLKSLLTIIYEGGNPGIAIQLERELEK